MINYITSDFDVELLYKKNNVALLGAIKGIFIHLIVVDNKALNQIYIHRQDWANFIIENKLKSTAKKETYCGVWISLDNKSKKTGIYFKEIAQLFSLEDTILGKQINVDVEKLSKIKSKLNQIAFKKKTLSKIGEDFDEKDLNDFTNWELETAAFEFSILTAKQRRTRPLGVFDILSFKQSNEIPIELFMEKLEWLVENESCDCGNESCFFDLLNNNFLTHFQDRKRFLKRNKFDKEKSEAIIHNFWTKLTPEKKAALLYLDKAFLNTPLLNIAFLSEDFNFWNYLRLMTYPYQPDSDDEAYVRKHSSVCAYYLFMNK